MSKIVDDYQMRESLFIIDSLKEKASFKELEFSKQRRIYENICDMIVKCDIRTFPNKTELIDKNLTHYILSVIIKELFQVENIDFFLDKVKVDHIIPSNEYDCVTILDEENKLENIFIWDYHYLTIIPNLAHEFIHAYYETISMEELMKTQINYHYHEIPAITTEQMVAYEAEKELNLPILKAMNATRLFHLKVNLDTYQEMDKDIWKIRGNQYLENIFNHQKHITFSYTISDIYATSLFQKYLEDKTTFLKLFNRLLKREITLTDLFDYYQISLKNHETIDQYQKKIESISK